MATIVLIEDETALQRTLAAALKDAGHTVVTASDGAAGLALAREHKPDAVILDLILPKMDGFSVLEALKKDKTTAHIPVVVLTNLEGPEDVERVVGLGATTYLVKANYDLSDVVNKVEEVLPRAQ
ncbi:MAG: response regulator [Patescibacteria group bacterium]